MQKGGSYCKAEQYCHDGFCLDVPLCSNTDGKLPVLVACECGGVLCGIGEYCKSQWEERPQCLETRVCESNAGHSMTPKGGCTCFIHGRVQQCKEGRFCHHNGCHATSQTARDVVYIGLTAILIICFLFGIFFWWTNRCPVRLAGQAGAVGNPRPEGVMLQHVAIEPIQEEGVEGFETAAVPGVNQPRI